MDISVGGPKLDPEWIEFGNNVCGTLRGWRDASVAAEHFVRAGWSSRSSSWYGYELETSWCQVEIDPVDGSDLLLNGVVDPERFHELAGLLDLGCVPGSGVRVRPDPGVCSGIGMVPAQMNGHRLIFEMSKLEGDQDRLGTPAAGARVRFGHDVLAPPGRVDRGRRVASAP
ncbi:hypothetical protein ABZ557_15380 [Streptomyces sp. NPDC019645]|uniref:hypothetical protein n=1 Tax=Streptomyces sp. NPDC019645 TaxID=3154786 RepID=UPI0033C2A4CD